MTHFRVKLKTPMSNTSRKAGPKFLSRESAHSWVSKFYPTRSYTVLACFEDENGKERELNLSQMATR